MAHVDLFTSLYVPDQHDSKMCVMWPSRRKVKPNKVQISTLRLRFSFLKMESRKATFITRGFVMIQFKNFNNDAKFTGS